MDDGPPRDRWRQPSGPGGPPPRSDVMSMSSILGPPGMMVDPSDPRAMRYERDHRERERDRDWEREREREREWERERERERDRDRPRGGLYPGGPSGRPPPPPGSDRRSPLMSFNPALTSPSGPPRRKWSDPAAEEAAFHREREWEREREREMEREREREMRWRASQRPGDVGPGPAHSRGPSGDVRYGAGGPSPAGPPGPAMTGDGSRSPRESFNSMAARKSPASIHSAAPSGARGVGAGASAASRKREHSGELVMGPESSPRHAAYMAHYDDPRGPPLPPPGHGSMLPPSAGRSPDRMRPPMSYGGYDPGMSERDREYEREMRHREQREREREREMMATDRYGRRIHPDAGGPMMLDESMYDRYGPRGPPPPPTSGPLGPPSAKSASGRGGYDERGPPPPMPYPPSSPTQNRETERRSKDKVKAQAAGAAASGPRDHEPGYPPRESPAPSASSRSGGPPQPYELERSGRPIVPPPGSTSTVPKLEPGVPPPSTRHAATLSPTSERGPTFRGAGPSLSHRRPSVPPYGVPMSEREAREREQEMALRREREMEMEQERERERLRIERERELEREREMERQREMERERQQQELERERAEREKEKEREKKERRREKQQAEKAAAALEREKERERQALQAQQAAAAAAAQQMHPGALGELPQHIQPPPASLEEALIATAQQQAAAYGRPPTLADFQQAAAAVGYPPGLPLPPGIHPAAFAGVPPPKALAPQPHVVRDPNAGPRVDSEPVWLYLELCERDEAIRRSQRLPLDLLSDEQQQQQQQQQLQEEAENGVNRAEPSNGQRQLENEKAPTRSANATAMSEPAEVSKGQRASTGTATAEAQRSRPLPVVDAPVDPLPRHLIGMDKGRPVRHLGSWLYDPTVDPLFPAELLARNVGATLEIRISGDLLSCGGRGGPHWEEYLQLEADCIKQREVGEPLKAYMESENGDAALNGRGNSWKLGWRGKEHARMSLEMRIEERVAEAQLFGEEMTPPAESNRGNVHEGNHSIKDATGSETVKAAKNGIVSPWQFWRLNPLLRRKLWGTDVYTDDSDVLAMCVHAGWVEGPSLEAEGIPSWVPPGRAARAWNGLSSSASSASMVNGASRGVNGTGEGVETASAETGQDKAKNAPRSSSKDSGINVPSDLSVILRIAPKLIAYKGCQRGGIKSRSWGNTHDGVSLVVESVEVKQPGYAQCKGRRAAKNRIDQWARFRAEPVAASPTTANGTNADDARTPDMLVGGVWTRTSLLPLSAMSGIKRKATDAVDADDNGKTEAAKPRLFWQFA
ncbi:hypothetical protein BCV70DRAFT_47610 [Testicularia cyperi]|uniref:Rxt3-domain-containing protein n=1 Tax=Testicularia cyperi TaxID=1882483 RepID=A0A317XHH9_9BASI|nr:hypothetical protein BCV70DRAFT_47610 [Testicularia cyperi]